MGIENLDRKIRAYSLKNALSHKGKANPGAVVSALFNEGLEKKDVKEVMLEINKIIKEISKLSLEKQEREFEKLKEFVSEREVREGLPELPGAEKGVIMRFAPAPSGALHVGHAVSSLISSLYVKKYGGKFYVRIEDTNPEKTDSQAYNSIREDCDWLFGNVSDYIIQSDRVDLYYGYAVSLIEKDSAYICECSGEKFRDFVKDKKDCPCRKKTIKQNILDWKKMLNKKGFKIGRAHV